MAATSFVPTQPVGTYHGEGKYGCVHAHAHVHLRVRSSMRRQMCMHVRVHVHVHVHVHMRIDMRLRLHTCVCMDVCRHARHIVYVVDVCLAWTSF